jgi:hypothetical protein
MDSTGVKRERRSKKRFSIEREVRYKLLNGQHIANTGIGRTLDMSSTGVQFTTQEPLPLGTLIEVAISWPALLNDNCPMKLVVFGRVVRSEKECVSITIEKYEFRTSGKLPLVLNPQPSGNLLRV